MFLPENIDLAHSEAYNLSIRLTPNGFSFFIYSPTDPAIFHYQGTSLGNKLTHVENIKKVIFDLGFFSQPFNTTTVTQVSPHFTLIPDAYFEKRQLTELFRFNFHDLEGRVLSNPSADGSYHIAFHLEEEIYSFLTRNLSNPSFQHHTSLLLPLFETSAMKQERRSCHLDFHERSVTLACFSGGSLITVNTFPAENAADTTYYIASIWEQLRFEQASDTLHLSGDIGSHRRVTDTLKKLIRHVELFRVTPTVILSEEQRSSLPTDILAALCV